MATRKSTRPNREGTALPQSLTPSQRLQFDIYGFVLLENALTSDEVERIRSALYRLRGEPDLGAHRVYINTRNDHHFHVGNLIEYDRAFLDYATHPGLLPLVEEVVGGAVRLEETEGILNSRDPKQEASGNGDARIQPLGLHTGTRHGWGTYQQQHHFRCLFVKTLAYLSDVGPDDGGTAVIPGSHRLDWSEPDMIEAALAQPSLLYQVEAKAGSVLLFPEALVHSTTAVQSERERAVVIAGYTPPMMRAWPGNQPTETFLDSLPEATRQLLTGGDGWPWQRHVDA